MALGSSNSVGKARGKSIAVVNKRFKEYKIAKNYNSFSASPVQAKSACSYPRLLSETFYHNGKGALPTTNDVVYKSKRARSNNKFTAGHYKVALGKTSKSLQINKAGVVIAVTNCP
jgi:hypothetical protein|tara:strand:+ start:360 stop:707 length:348 start_codon:yes stop_codon:yes gene_type:complete